MADVTLTEDERVALELAARDDRERRHGYVVRRSDGTDTPTVEQTVEAIVAARVAAALGEVEARLNELPDFDMWMTVTRIVREVRGEVAP